MFKGGVEDYIVYYEILSKNPDGKKVLDFCMYYLLVRLDVAPATNLSDII